MKSLKQTIMERDNLTEEEAAELIKAAKDDLHYRLIHPHKCGAPEDICADHFGLEPDYLMDLI